MLVHVFSLVLAVVTASFYSQESFADNQPGLPLDSLTTAIQKSDSLYQSYMGFFTRATYENGNKVGSYGGFLAYEPKSGKMRYETITYFRTPYFLTSSPTPKEIYVFDGKKGQTWYGTTGQYPTVGQIAEGNLAWQWHFSEDRFLWVIFQPHFLQEVLLHQRWGGKSINPASLQVAGREKLGQDECIVLQFITSYYLSFPLQRVRIWLNTAKGYRINKMETYGPETYGRTDQSVIDHNVINVVLVGKDIGIWLPKEVEILSYCSGELLRREVTRLKPDFQVNVDIPAEIYNITRSVEEYVQSK